MAALRGNGALHGEAPELGRPSPARVESGTPLHVAFGSPKGERRNCPTGARPLRGRRQVPRLGFWSCAMDRRMDPFSRLREKVAVGRMRVPLARSPPDRGALTLTLSCKRERGPDRSACISAQLEDLRFELLAPRRKRARGGQRTATAAREWLTRRRPRRAEPLDGRPPLDHLRPAAATAGRVPMPPMTSGTGVSRRRQLDGPERRRRIRRLPAPAGHCLARDEPLAGASGFLRPPEAVAFGFLRSVSCGLLRRTWASTLCRPVSSPSARGQGEGGLLAAGRREPSSGLRPFSHGGSSWGSAGRERPEVAVGPPRTPRPVRKQAALA